MRITNSMLVSNMIENLNSSISRMSTTQIQLSTGKKITKLSDNPTGVSQSMQSSVSISKTKQYSANVEDARTIMNFTETALMDMNDLVTRSYELTIEAANTTNSVDETKAIALEIGQIKEQMIDTMNSTYNQQYIFGGNNVSEAPFSDVNGEILYNGVNLVSGNEDLLNTLKGESISFILGKGIKMDVTKSGIDVVGSGANNIITMMGNLVKDLESNNKVDGYITKLKNAKENVLALTAEIGGKSNRLDTITTRYKSDLLNYAEIQSNVEDIDQSAVITEYKMQEALYEAALAVGARVIQPSLVDFLR